MQVPELCKGAHTVERADGRTRVQEGARQAEEIRRVVGCWRETGICRSMQGREERGEEDRCIHAARETDRGTEGVAQRKRERGRQRQRKRKKMDDPEEGK